jgi:tetratricopeptide (TPR) repeat protein
VRSALACASAAALLVLGGCGVVQDMRSEYVANRALRDATEELKGDAPHLEHVRGNLDLAYRLRRQDPRFLARLAEPYQSAGGYEKAIRCYEAASGLTGDTYDSQTGYCLLKLGKTKAGVERIERALKAASAGLAVGRIDPPRYANILNDAGYGLVDANVRVDQAFDLIEEAVRLEPLVPAYVDSLGWAYYRRGEFEDAAFHLERAARLLGRRDAEILWHLGAVHARLGKLHRAESELRQAIALDPSNAEAKKMLREMLRELPPPAIA